MSQIKKRVLIILYSGNYYDAYTRWINGLGEAYTHHNYALSTISQLSKQENVEEVAVLSCATQEIYDHSLDIGFRVMGVGLDPYKNFREINRLVSQYRPTHIILRTPLPSVLDWSIKNNVRVITLFADSFIDKSLKSRFNYFRLSRLLNHPQIEWVGNHHINSCRSLEEIGVSPRKIIPWDWPRDAKTPLDFEPKKGLAEKDKLEFLYVGLISKSKGVLDIIESIALLKSKGIVATLKIAGKANDLDLFKEKAYSLNIEESIVFLGLIPNDKVIHLMHDSDIVFVPSHHSYAEGLPSTIYEALCSRTPIIASDHPMFLENIEDGYSALIFPEKNTQALVNCVEKLLQDPELYSRLSHNAHTAWEKLQIPVTWADLIHKWVSDTAESCNWIKEHALLGEHYKSKIKA